MTTVMITIQITNLPYLLTYLLTHSMEQSPSWEANWFSVSQEIPRILWNPKVHYHIYKCRPVPILYTNILASGNNLFWHSGHKVVLSKKSWPGGPLIYHQITAVNKSLITLLTTNLGVRCMSVMFGNTSFCFYRVHNVWLRLKHSMGSIPQEFFTYIPVPSSSIHFLKCIWPSNNRDRSPGVGSILDRNKNKNWVWKPTRRLYP